MYPHPLWEYFAPPPFVHHYHKQSKAFHLHIHLWWSDEDIFYVMGRSLGSILILLLNSSNNSMTVLNYPHNVFVRLSIGIPTFPSPATWNGASVTKITRRRDVPFTDQPMSWIKKKIQYIKYIFIELKRPYQSLPMLELAWEEKIIQSKPSNENTNSHGWLYKYSNKSCYCLTIILVYKSNKIVSHCSCKLFIFSTTFLV